MEGLERILAEHRLFAGLGKEFIDLAAGCAKISLGARANSTWAGLRSGTPDLSRSRTTGFLSPNA